MNRKNKKGVLLCCLSKAWGGQEMVVYEMAVKMRANGIQVTTACLSGSPLQTKLEAIQLATIGVAPKFRYCSPGTIRTLRAAFKSGAFSSVLVHQLADLWHVVPALIGRPGIQVVGVSHTFVGISKKDLLHRLIYSRLNQLIVLTESHRQNLLKHLPVKNERFVILPNTIDVTRFSPTRRSQAVRDQYLLNKKAIFVGVVTRFDAAKGLMEVLDAATSLKQWSVPVEIVIFGEDTVGQPGMKANYAREIESRDLKQIVHLAGYRSDIEAVMASVDVLLMPSPAETFGRVLIEAMASQVAIVASSGGGVPDIIHHENTGLLVKPLDSESMARAIRYYVENPEQRQKIASNALTVARDVYDFHKVDEKLYKLLDL